MIWKRVNGEVFQNPKKFGLISPMGDKEQGIDSLNLNHKIKHCRLMQISQQNLQIFKRDFGLFFLCVKNSKPHHGLRVEEPQQLDS